MNCYNVSYILVFVFWLYCVIVIFVLVFFAFASSVLFSTCDYENSFSTSHLSWILLMTKTLWRRIITWVPPKLIHLMSDWQKVWFSFIKSIHDCFLKEQIQWTKRWHTIKKFIIYDLLVPLYEVHLSRLKQYQCWSMLKRCSKCVISNHPML